MSVCGDVGLVVACVTVEVVQLLEVDEVRFVVGDVEEATEAVVCAHPVNLINVNQLSQGWANGGLRAECISCGSQRES